jgi:hypothetical protein
MLDMVAQRYGKRPSQIIDPGDTLEDWVRYSLDTAIALRCKIEESNAMKEAMRDDDDDADNPDLVTNRSKKPEKTAVDRRREEKVAGQNIISMQNGRMLGGISGKVGEFDPKLGAEYTRLGGTLPVGNERDDRVARMLESRRIDTQRRREEAARKEEEKRARREARRARLGK